MWMMGCTGDAAGGLSSPAATSLKKLRPDLVARHSANSAYTAQIASSSSSSNSSSPSCPPTNYNSCFGSINGHDHFFALRNQYYGTGDNGKRELVGTTGQQAVSSRWNPTPEQLRMLEDLYQRGTRTPSADQIQHITAQLRRFGKIEGKNVFYWFQNHKARERQKRRRKVESEDHDPLEHSHHSPGAQAVDLKEMISKNNNIPCTDNIHQESSCLCARFLTPSSSDSRKSGEWQVVHLVPASPPPSYVAATATATTVAATAVEIVNVHDEELANAVLEKQTLELFPLHNDLSHHQGAATSQLPNTSLGAFEFYQFLPLKH